VEVDDDSEEVEVKPETKAQVLCWVLAYSVRTDVLHHHNIGDNNETGWRGYL
jgi:hypothetical protein